MGVLAFVCSSLSLCMLLTYLLIYLGNGDPVDPADPADPVEGKPADTHSGEVSVAGW